MRENKGRKIFVFAEVFSKRIEMRKIYLLPISVSSLVIASVLEAAGIQKEEISSCKIAVFRAVMLAENLVKLLLREIHDIVIPEHHENGKRIHLKKRAKPLQTRDFLRVRFFLIRQIAEKYRKRASRLGKSIQSPFQTRVSCGVCRIGGIMRICKNSDLHNNLTFFELR